VAGKFTVSTAQLSGSSADMQLLHLISPMWLEAMYSVYVEVVIKCKTLPRWFAGTRALDGGYCEQKVSRYCRYVYQNGKIGPS
jgi:hypothetical protein